MQEIQEERRSWLKFSVLLLYIFGFGLLTVIAGEGDTPINPDDDRMIALLKVLQIVSVLFVFILPAILFSVFWTNARIHYLGVTTKPALKTIILSSIVMLVATPLINWLGELNQHMRLPEAFHGIESWMKNSEAKATELTEAFTNGTSIGVLIINLFVVAFMAALSEEIFFRGVLQKVVIECTRNKHLGIWIAAALFSAFHMQFYGFFPRMLMGAYLGYLFLWSGSLWPGMIAHFFNNGMAVYLMWLEHRGVISSDINTIGAEKDQWILVLTSAIFVLIGIIIVYLSERRTSNSINKQWN